MILNCNRMPYILFYNLIFALCLFCNQTRYSKFYVQAYNESLLIAASKSGQLDLVHQLILSHPINIDYKDIHGNTPLLIACEYQHFKIAKMLINHGADVNFQSVESNGLTPLMMSSWRCNNHLVRLLHSHNANLELRDYSNNMTALLFATINKCIYTVRLLVSYHVNLEVIDFNTKSTPLLWAIDNHDLEMTRELLRAGANVDAEDKNFTRGLHIAYRESYLDICKELIYFAANTDIDIKHLRIHPESIEQQKCREYMQIMLPINYFPYTGYFERFLFLKRLFVRLHDTYYPIYQNISYIFDKEWNIFHRNVDFLSSNTIKIYFNMEHSLKYFGGLKNPKYNESFPSISKYPYIYNQNKNYSLDFQRLLTTDADLIIDYSSLNILVYQESNMVNEDVLKRMVYIPPFVRCKNIKFHRSIDVLSTFYVILGSRERVISNLIMNNISFTNINNISYNLDPNIFVKTMQNYYCHSKILINIHQDDPQGHIFEEIRVLHAMLCKVVVISETSPLQEKLPFFNFIIWVDSEKMHLVIPQVLQNYDYYYHKFYGKGSPLYDIWEEMESKSLMDLKRAIDYIEKKKQAISLS